MANKASESLWQLIRSMTKTEKRYFILNGLSQSGASEKPMKNLFSVIGGQEVYNEELVLRKFKGTGIGRHFSLAKNRLYASILRSLETFHAATSPDASLQRQIHSAEILLKKSLPDQAVKVLRSARRLAEENEMHHRLLDIAHLEQRIIERTGYDSVDDPGLAERTLENRQVMEQISLNMALWDAKSSLFHMLYTRGRARSKKDEEGFVGQLEIVRSQITGKKLSIQNTYLWQHLEGVHAFHTGNLEQCLHFLRANLSLIEHNKKNFEFEPGTYLSVLTNAIAIASRLGKKGLTDAFLAKLGQQEFDLDDNEGLTHFFMAKAAWIGHFMQQRQLNRAGEIMKSLEGPLGEVGDRLSTIRRAQFYFNFTLICLAEKDFHGALKWNNRLVLLPGIDRTIDIYCMSQLIRLVIHLELGNTDLLPFILRSTQRYLLARQRIYRFESIFLEFINEYLKKRRTKNDRELLTDLEARLNSLANDPLEQPVFEYFDFIGWAGSKAAGLSPDNERAA